MHCCKIFKCSKQKFSQLSQQFLQLFNIHWLINLLCSLAFLTAITRHLMLYSKIIQMCIFEIIWSSWAKSWLNSPHSTSTNLKVLRWKHIFLTAIQRISYIFPAGTSIACECIGTAHLVFDVYKLSFKGVITSNCSLWTCDHTLLDQVYIAVVPSTLQKSSPIRTILLTSNL